MGCAEITGNVAGRHHGHGANEPFDEAPKAIGTVHSFPVGTPPLITRATIRQTTMSRTGNSSTWFGCPRDAGRSRQSGLTDCIFRVSRRVEGSRRHGGAARRGPSGAATLLLGSHGSNPPVAHGRITKTAINTPLAVASCAARRASLLCPQAHARAPLPQYSPDRVTSMK